MGWYYTPSVSYDLCSVQTRFGFGAGLGAVTFPLYDEAPSTGGAHCFVRLSLFRWKMTLRDPPLLQSVSLQAPPILLVFGM